MNRYKLVNGLMGTFSLACSMGIGYYTITHWDQVKWTPAIAFLVFFFFLGIFFYLILASRVFRSFPTAVKSNKNKQLYHGMKVIVDGGSVLYGKSLRLVNHNYMVVLDGKVEIMIHTEDIKRIISVNQGVENEVDVPVLLEKMRKGES